MDSKPKYGMKLGFILKSSSSCLSFVRFCIKMSYILANDIIFNGVLKERPGIACRTGAGCSKLTTALVNVSLKFQMLISQIRQYFLLKKCEKLLQ